VITRSPEIRQQFSGQRHCPAVPGFSSQPGSRLLGFKHHAPNETKKASNTDITGDEHGSWMMGLPSDVVGSTWSAAERDREALIRVHPWFQSKRRPRPMRKLPVKPTI
jgi:hypothetical protein